MKSYPWLITVASVLAAGLLALAVTPGLAESRIIGVAAMTYDGSMALNDDGTVWLWGTQDFLDGPGSGHALIGGADHVTAVSSDIYPITLRDDGTVWFENIRNNTSEKLEGFSDIVAISGGQGGLLGVGKDGTVWYCYAWTSHDATRVDGLSDVVAVAEGDTHNLSLKKDGTVWAWGSNNMGEVGDGTIDPPRMTYIPHPLTKVKGLDHVKAIAAGAQFSMALRDDGTVWTWGRNWEGELGDGKPGEVEGCSPGPVQVKGLTNVTSIAAGQWYALALRDDGTVWSWGDNRYFGMLGDGTTESKYAPVQVTGLSNIVSISTGWQHSLALDNTGTVWAWGSDDTGQLGDGRAGKNLYRTTAEKVPFTEALAGPAIEPGWKASPRPVMPVKAPVPGVDQIEYIAAVNDTIYAFSENRLIAMDKNAVPRWDLSLPGRWTFGNADYINTMLAGEGIVSQRVKPAPVFSTENGYVYLYTLAGAFNGTYEPLLDIYNLPRARLDVEKELIAVAPDGRVEWIRRFTDDIAVEDRSQVEARDGRIYLYHGYNETVLDSSGNTMFTVENIAGPISLDEDGCYYAIPAMRTAIPWYPDDMSGMDFDYRKSSNVVEKYAPDGTLSWRKELRENISRFYCVPSVQNEVNGMPLCRGGVLYVPLDKGIMAMDKDGDILWTKTFDIAYWLFYQRPVDADGNLYLIHHFNYHNSSYDNAYDTIVVLGPDGDVVARVNKKSIFLGCSPDGVLYEPVAVDGIGTTGIRAYDIIQGRYLWNLTLPIGDMHTVVLDESNAPGLINDVNQLPEVIPEGDLAYINYRQATWDKPVVYGQSKYTYYSAIYAVDRNGTIVWQKPTDSFVMAAAANNTTIYYGTKDGGISVSTIGAAAGAAVVIGAALLFFKFFVLGGVARARYMTDKNDNRMRILRFIAERPGSTLYEVQKGLGLNMGTVRYHLAILGMGHRTATHNDGKFVRYFTNSNTYSPEDRMIISLLRRESMGGVLTAVVSGGGLTNSEICRVVGLPESAVSRYLGELIKKGVVSRDTGRSVGAIYSVRPEHRLRILGAMRLLDESLEAAASAPCGLNKCTRPPQEPENI